MSHGKAAEQRARRAATARRRLALGSALILLALGGGTTACSQDRPGPPDGTSPYDAAGDVSFGGRTGEDADRAVDPSQPLKITTGTEGVRITDVSARDQAGRTIAGELDADGSAWRSTTPLAAGAEYTVRIATEDAAGRPGRTTHVVRTSQAERAERLQVEFAPEPGTYGVGHPVVAELSEPVTDAGERALVESALRVSSEPAAEGSWYWVEDDLLHYRPREYWPANAIIRVSADLEGLRIRDGLRGGGSEELVFRTGDRVEAVADIAALTLTVKRNGEVLRQMPMTTGKEGFRTRNGKKVILGRESQVRMRGTSVGIAAGSAEDYDLDVRWAARLTWSGEYVHAAPWSLGSHGVANVSHGCTGLSTENARWFFENVRVGDIVEHINGSGADMAFFGNGFGDWNMEWEQWQQGSALAADTPDRPVTSPHRLRPGV
ncbi:L,D-transpeptidase [Streptomyces aidingensis]|uniref:Lipoprotein-anchoring transpeptidase ErfK/SrfK n=1 Tax=Streptomyces aidingensis TaxID=910347 RepID=A0A1I1LHH7_9ACTN|nr:Ig-like domain-containing protein [Streptomyces aidingensis]SFC71982.1 Lipoprotein-anchoring transpeptidase ErfK/SrfK [Streptomyces aidingensis]